jgi:hypothetical protein
MRSLSALLLVACTTPPPSSPPAPCTRPSRACTLQAIAAATPDLARFATETYGGYGATALAKLHERGFDALVVDPAIVLRLDAFARFATDAKDPWLARERFAASLGVHRIYRGIALDDADIARLRADGILSPQLRTKTPPLGGHLIDQIGAHVMGLVRDEDQLMSVSDDPAVSKCVAHTYAKDGKHVVVFAVDAPALDVVAIDEHAALCPAAPPPNSVACKPSPPPYPEPVRGMLCRGLYDPAVESFVLHRIDPAEIVAAKTETEFADCDEVLRKTTHDLGVRAAAARKACQTFEQLGTPEVIESVPPIQK